MGMPCVKWYILSTQTREGQTILRFVPLRQTEEKSDLPKLGLEEYHSCEYRISDLISQTVTVKFDGPSQRWTVNPDSPPYEGRSGFTIPLSEGRLDFTVIV